MYILGNTMHNAWENFFQPKQGLWKTQRPLAKTAKPKATLLPEVGTKVKGERVFVKGSARERASSRRWKEKESYFLHYQLLFFEIPYVQFENK